MATQARGGERGYIVAADSDQAAIVIDAAAGLIRRTAGLGDVVRVESQRLVSLVNGASVTALAADAASSWGLKPSLVIVDEVGQWAATRNARGVWSAMVSAMGKVKGARLVCLTSAGSPSHWSAKVLANAKTSKAWRVHEIPGPLPWVSEEFLVEQRRLLLPSEYARLHLNEWTQAEDSLIDPSDLAACVTLAGPQAYAPGNSYVITVDLGIKNDRTVAMVAHGEHVGDDALLGTRVVLDRLQVWAGSRRNPVQLADVEEWIAHAATSFGGARIVFDPWQAAGLQQRLSTRGLAVTEFVFSAQSVGRLASTLGLLLRNHLIALPDDPDLLQELLAVRLRETSPGVVRLDHDADGHDDRAVTLAMAASEIISQSSTPIIDGYLTKDAPAAPEGPPPTLAQLIGRASSESFHAHLAGGDHFDFGGGQ